MKVFIAGIDGYLGWSLAQYLAARGHAVGGCDIGLRRDMVDEIGSHSIVPIASMEQRLKAYEGYHGQPLTFYWQDLTDYEGVKWMMNMFMPDTWV